MNELFAEFQSYLRKFLPVRYVRQLVQSENNIRKLITATADGDVVLCKQLLVDVSVIMASDARTGIQRVVRALLVQLLNHDVIGYCVKPVYATRKHGYRYAPENFCGLSDGTAQKSDCSKADSIVQVGPGDIFLGLDLAAHLLPLHSADLAKWKNLGVEIHVVVYDLLPVLSPQWFNVKTTRNFTRWIKTIAIYADSIVCISDAAKSEVNVWLQQKYGLVLGELPINVIPLGADLLLSAPSYGLPDNSDGLMMMLAEKPFVLMVGTLEPRKGHAQIVEIFNQLWLQSVDVRLVIVGKSGWKTEDLQDQLKHHPFVDSMLFWLDNVTDEFLGVLYKACNGVLLASKAEGFGLPLIEAMHYKKPVLARDIPVFREVGKDNVDYFSDQNDTDCMNDVNRWLSRISLGKEVAYRNLPSWQDSLYVLLHYLGLGAKSGDITSVAIEVLVK